MVCKTSEKAEYRLLGNDLYSRLVGYNVQKTCTFIYVKIKSPPQHTSEKNFSFLKNKVRVV